MLTPVVFIQLALLGQLGPDPVAQCDTQREDCNHECPRPGAADRESCLDACNTRRDNCLAAALNPQLKPVAPPAPEKPAPTAVPPQARPQPSPARAQPAPPPVAPRLEAPPPKPVKRRTNSVPPKPRPAIREAPAPAVVEATPPASEPSFVLAPFPLIDVGFTGGLNNPGGTVGGEFNFFLWPEFALGVAGGYGAWGPRFTPKLEVFPLAFLRLGLFVDAGVDLNLGGYSVLAGKDGTIFQTVDQQFTAAANASLGWRLSLGPHFWVAARAGWCISLPHGTNVLLRGVGTIAPPLSTALALAQPGGFVLGGSIGFSLGDEPVNGPDDGSRGSRRDAPTTRPRSMQLLEPGR